MIPQDYITAWNGVVPWASQRRVEQDLIIISRAIVAIFSDPFLRDELRFRGGTALNKLHFPKPLRYSEDIDLVRTTAGPIRPLLEHLQDVLDPWLVNPRFDQSPIAPKLKYAVEAEDKASPGPIKLKIEINTREREAYDPPIEIPFRCRKSMVHRKGRNPDLLSGRNAGDQAASLASTQQGPRSVRPRLRA